MYLVRMFDGPEDKKGSVIHTPFSNDLKLSSGKVNQVLNAVSDFNFTIPISNPAWDRIRPLNTLIEVKDLKLNQPIFNGRVLRPKGKMSSGGIIHKAFDCECKLSYLNDSLQRHMEIHDTTVRDFFAIMINVHNNQVEPHKRFKVGNVTVSNSTDIVYRYLGYESTFASIKEKLIDRLGGYIVVREEADGTYLDYLESVGVDVPEKPIKLTDNLQSMSYDINPTQVITRLVPLGERIESEDEEATDASQARLTIADVNGGKDYIDDPELQEEFGIIVREVIWDDVTTAQRLMTNGTQFLKNQKAASTSYTVNSVNTELLSKELLTFELGNRYPLVNPLLNVNEFIQVIVKGIDILNPQRSDLTIGDKYRTLSQYQASANKRSKIVVDLQSRVESQSKAIATFKNEVDTTKREIANVQELMDEVDLVDLPEAMDSLEQAIGNLNDALDGIPIYGLATHENDGLMASADKVKLDALESYEEATELQAGLMSAGDKKKLNRITVTKNIDLDNLLARIEALENPQDPPVE